jgi:hypothetical protein
MRLAFVLFAVPVAVHGADLHAGAAQVVITPSAGAPMYGYYYNRAAEGVHDDLHARHSFSGKTG